MCDVCPTTRFLAENDQTGEKLSKMVRNGQKWSKVVKSGQKWSKVVKNDQNWSKMTKKTEIVENCCKRGPKITSNKFLENRKFRLKTVISAKKFYR